MSAKTEMQWYVLRAIGGKEKKVKEYIDAAIRNGELTDYVSQVLIPTEKVYSIVNGKKISRERVSYPGYVLIEARLIGEAPHILRNITNVMGFLGNPKDPAMGAIPLRQDEVNRILGFVDEMAESEEVNETPFLIGETVKVVDGPFESFVGTIDEIDEERRKLTVSVKIFGGKTPMELDFVQVEKEL
ncbi:MAG: transcription termination/antitermination protein NusG [Rikenellaceae bacterium]